MKEIRVVLALLPFSRKDSACDLTLIFHIIAVLFVVFIILSLYISRAPNVIWQGHS